MDSGVVQSIIAVVVALFGGAGLKIVERWLSRGQVKEDYGLKLRTELREDLNRLRTQLEETETELDQWREKYFTLLEQFVNAKAKLEDALTTIQRNAEKAQSIVENPPDGVK